MNHRTRKHLLTWICAGLLLALSLLILSTTGVQGVLPAAATALPALAIAVAAFRGHASSWLPLSCLCLGTLSAFAISSSMVTADYGSGAHGTVVDSTGRPIADATVRTRFDQRVFRAIEPLSKSTTHTDAEGHFYLAFISCGKPGGAYQLVAEKAGYRRVQVHGSGLGLHRLVLQKLP